MTHEALARKLRILRAARGITLAEAEELTGVTRETLGALEHGPRRWRRSPGGTASQSAHSLVKLRSRKRSWHWRGLPQKLIPRGRRGVSTRPWRQSGAHKKTSSASSGA
jgi:hypothetical protein